MILSPLLAMSPAPACVLTSEKPMSFMQLAEVGGVLAVVAGEFDFAEARGIDLAQRAFEIFLRFGLDRPQLDAERDLAVMIGQGDAAHQRSGRQASSRGHEKRTSAKHESAPLFVESAPSGRGPDAGVHGTPGPGVKHADPSLLELQVAVVIVPGNGLFRAPVQRNLR